MFKSLKLPLKLTIKPHRTRQARNGSVPSHRRIIEVHRVSSLVSTLFSEVCVFMASHGSGISLVYDVSNRESFDALPRWYSELETYVSSSVVKIVVGNKVDKVYWPCILLT